MCAQLTLWCRRVWGQSMYINHLELCLFSPMHLVIYSIIYIIITHGYLFCNLSYISILCYFLCCWIIVQCWALGALSVGSSVPLAYPRQCVNVCVCVCECMCVSVLALPYFLALQDAVLHFYLLCPRLRISHSFKKLWSIVWRMIVIKTWILEDHLCLHYSQRCHLWSI